MSASFTTVREVIARLQKLPQNAIVVMSPDEPWDTSEGQVDGVGGFVLMDGFESRSGWNLVDVYDSGQPHQLVVLTVNSDDTPEMVFETMADFLEGELDEFKEPNSVERPFRKHVNMILEKVKERLS